VRGPGINVSSLTPSTSGLATITPSTNIFILFINTTNSTTPTASNNTNAPTPELWHQQPPPHIVFITVTTTLFTKE
jgi:hypothetical protein